MNTDDKDLAAAFPNSPEMFVDESTPEDPAVRAAFPNSPEMFEGAAPAPQAGWADKVRAEYGPAFDQTLADARSVVKRYGDAELAAALNETGLGDHPAVVRFVAKVAAAMKGR